MRVCCGDYILHDGLYIVFYFSKCCTSNCNLPTSLIRGRLDGKYINKLFFSSPARGAVMAPGPVFVIVIAIAIAIDIDIDIAIAIAIVIAIVIVIGITCMHLLRF